MPKWKTRDPRNKFKSFLEHLDSNYYDKKRRKISHLKVTFYPYAEKLIGDFEKEGIIERKKDVINITLSGYNYLDHLRELKIKNELLDIEREKVLVELMAISSIIITLLVGLQKYLLLNLTAWIFGLGVIILGSILFRRYFKILLQKGL